MLEIAKFKSCRPPGSLNNRSLWKDHLKEYHSPEARLSNPVAEHKLFYMDDRQWRAVQDRIAHYTHRPRPYDEWFEVQKRCFLEVWRILFPKERYPSLNEPLSPFHLDSSSVANLGSRIGILLDTIRKARAERAVSAGSIRTTQDFQPTDAQHMEMMVQAVAIAINMSPSASQWVANVSPEGLQAAVADYDQTTLRAEDINSEAVTSITSPKPAIHPNSESTPSDNSTDPTTAVIPTPILLYPGGTQICLQVSPNQNAELNQQQAFMTATLPPGYFINDIRQSDMSSAPNVASDLSGLSAPSGASMFGFPAEPGPSHQFTNPSIGPYTTLLESSDETMD
ncbi:hypothetical protein K449DRAFT_240231 [Hypoxylon sp. EC38]|nr:hypothetical protein K449DRAFT_240231 [Hypoxylon sp. EC38]